MFCFVESIYRHVCKWYTRSATFSLTGGPRFYTADLFLFTFFYALVKQI